jgi:hypothetical protein
MAVFILFVSEEDVFEGIMPESEFSGFKNAQN